MGLHSLIQEESHFSFMSRPSLCTTRHPTKTGDMPSLVPIQTQLLDYSWRTTFVVMGKAKGLRQDEERVEVSAVGARVSRKEMGWESQSQRGGWCAQHRGNGGAQPTQKLCLRCHPPRSLSRLTLLGPGFFEKGLTLLLMPSSKLKGSIVVYSCRWVSREKRCDDFGKEKKLNCLAISPEMPFSYCKSKTH